MSKGGWITKRRVSEDDDGWVGETICGRGEFSGV